MYIVHKYVKEIAPHGAEFKTQRGCEAFCGNFVGELLTEYQFLTYTEWCIIM